MDSTPIMAMKLSERLARIAEIIEAVDNRCAAADGPVTLTLSEMTQAEISEIYALASCPPLVVSEEGCREIVATLQRNPLVAQARAEGSSSPETEAASLNIATKREAEHALAWAKANGLTVHDLAAVRAERPWRVPGEIYV